MTRLQRVLISLYRRLLSGYPKSFQSTFASEMLNVFTDGLVEAARQGRGALLRFLARELVFLPLEMLRQHRAQPAPVPVAPVPMTPLAYIGQRVFSYRRCNRSALLLSAAFALFVVMPFFALGLYREPAAAVAGGMFDPKGYPFFQTTLGGWSRVAGFLAVLLAQIFLPLLGLRLLYSLLRRGRGWAPRQRWLGYISLLLVVTACAFLLSPLGRTIVLWYFD